MPVEVQIGKVKKSRNRESASDSLLVFQELDWPLGLTAANMHTEKNGEAERLQISRSSSTAQCAASSADTSGDASADTNHSVGTMKLIDDVINSTDCYNILGVSRDASGDALRHKDQPAWKQW